MDWLLLAMVAVLLLGCVPVSLDVFVRTGETPPLAVKPRWGALSGRDDPGPSAWASEARAMKGRPKRQRTSASREGAKRVSWRKVLALLSSEDFLLSLARWFRRIIAVLAPREVRLRLRIGTGDPYETGRLWSALSPCVVYLTDVAAADLELMPDFVDRTFELHAYALVRFVPLVLLATTLSYFFTRAPWRALHRFARA